MQLIDSLGFLWQCYSVHHFLWQMNRNNNGRLFSFRYRGKLDKRTKKLLWCFNFLRKCNCMQCTVQKVSLCAKKGVTAHNQLFFLFNSPFAPFNLLILPKITRIESHPQNQTWCNLIFSEGKTTITTITTTTITTTMTTTTTFRPRCSLGKWSVASFYLVFCLCVSISTWLLAPPWVIESSWPLCWQFDPRWAQTQPTTYRPRPTNANDEKKKRRKRRRQQVTSLIFSRKQKF